MIKVEKLNKYFNRNKKNEVHVINDTTLEFEDTGLVCILGESGSGKTTLLNTMGGLDSFSKGTITVDGETMKGYSASKMDKLRNRKYGYVFQNYYLLSDYTVEYNIKLALKCLNMSDEDIEERVNYVLSAVEMRRYKKKLVSELSGGQRQRVAIARALAKTPDIIFADEPTGNLDENNTLRIMSILRKISKKCLVILVTHEQRIADFFADRIINIKDGVVVSDKMNSKSVSYASNEDINIYLKELDVKEYTLEDNTIRVYSDGTSFPVKVNIVFSNGKLYIETDEKANVEFVSEDTETELIDDVKPRIDMEQIDNFDFELDKVDASGKNALSFKELLTMAGYNIRNIGRNNIFMYIVFAISAVLMLLTVSDFYRVLNAKPYEKVSYDSHYVDVKCEKFGIATRAYAQFKNESGLKGDVVSYDTNVIRINSNNYSQLINVSQGIKRFTYVDVKNLDESKLLYGRMPENENEIVIDKAVLEGVIAESSVLSIICDEVKEFLNATAMYKGDIAEFYICGISDSEEMSIYLDSKWIEWSGMSPEEQYGRKNFRIYTDTPKEVEAYFDKLNEEYIKEYGKENANRKPVIEAEYVYGAQLDAYEQKVEDDIKVRTIITGIVVLLSVLVLAFTMKANSMRRTNELIVYRLIGITPWNILESYIIEIVTITAMTQAVPILITTIVCHLLSKMKAFEVVKLCPWNYIVYLMIGIFVVNIIVSLLSVIGIIKRPPAQLAVKN